MAYPPLFPTMTDQSKDRRMSTGGEKTLSTSQQ